MSMNKPTAAAAPVSGIIPFAELLADPEIAALLDFEPAVRKTARHNGWTPGLQRELIARIAYCGSPGAAVEQMDKNPTRAKHLYRTEGADSFRAAWNSAIALAEERDRARRESRPGRPTAVPGMSNRPVGRQALRRPRGGFEPWSAPLLPGQVYNERGEPEDKFSLKRRGVEAQESIASKLLRCRRVLLAEISDDPGKRAAFELLTELPIDWAKAERLEPQDHEPWRQPRMRQADMVVTAENGWFGSVVPDYGPDKIGELRRAINEARVERGLEPINTWSAEADDGADTPDDDADSVLRDWAARNAEPEGPVEEDLPTDPPPSRTFGLNSREFHDAVREPEDEPWIANGALPKEPRTRDPEPVVKTGPAPKAGPASGKGKRK